MNEALAQMLAAYKCRSLEDHLRALREILQLCKRAAERV